MKTMKDVANFLTKPVGYTPEIGFFWCDHAPVRFQFGGSSFGDFGFLPDSIFIDTPKSETIVYPDGLEE